MRSSKLLLTAILVSAAATAYSQSWSLSGNALTGPERIGSTNSSDLRFITNNHSRMILTKFGYLGIGTGVPAARLDVNGDALIHDLTIGRGGAAGSDNTAIGYQTLYSNTIGFGNTANGYNALHSNTTGFYNTANGSEALYSNVSAGYNSANGYQALYSNSTGFSNTANGFQALYSNTIGYLNTANGQEALYYNTEGQSNTATGVWTLYSNTTGKENTATGLGALYKNTTGEDNTANGVFTLENNTTGGANVAIGAFSVQYNTTGSYNSAIGYASLISNTVGNFNTAVGYYTLGYTTTGDENTASGSQALFSNTTGYSNTANGYTAGSFNNNNNSCTFIGYNADQSVTTDFSNSTALGNASRITASNQVRIGNSSTTSIGGYEPWTDISDSRFKKQIQENVPGIEFINKLKPVTYHLDVTGLRKFLGEDITGEEGQEGFKEMDAEHKALIEEGVKKKEQIIYTGFIAQDVEAAAKELGYDFSGVDAPQNEHSLYGLRYSQFVVPLVKAVQELSSENETLKMEIDELKSELASVKYAIDHQPLLMSDYGGGISSPSGKTEKVLLGQNIPNPFGKTTLIPFRIPKDCNDAFIVIVESSTGKTVNTIPVSCSETQLSLDAGALASGSYNYSLYVDGQVIGTRKMIISK